MPQIQYPFIDIAVHPAVRAKFAAGDAIALFSRDMTQVLWANGEGAKLFGYSDIYDLLDEGPDRSGVAFRQLAATARQLETIGDRRGLMMRINTGFSSQAVSAEVSLVEIRCGEIVVIFSAPVAANSNFKTRLASMLKGFDDPDTHMAVIDDQGTVLVASPGFEALGVLPETSRTLIGAVEKSGEGLVKRPIASAAGYLPAAIGRLSIDPPLNLLFCVETVLGRMDPPQEPAEPAAPNAAPAEANYQEEVPATVEDSVSLPDVDETEELPVEGLVETAGQTELEPEHAAPAAEENADATEQSRAVEPAADMPQDIQLAADQAEAASTPSVDEEKIAPEDAADLTAPSVEMPGGEDILHNLELAADQAETSWMPPAAEDDHTLDVVPENPELAADEAEARDMAQDADAFEPEDHVEAEVAEAALNEGVSEEDARDLASLDDASAEQVSAYGSGEDESIEENEDLDEQQAATDTGLSEEVPAEELADAVETPATEEIVGEPPAEAAPAEAAADLQAEPAVEAEAAPQSELETLESSAPPEEQPAAEPAFVFRRDGRPVRFVWKLDAQGRFSDVSEEFPRTVGPHAGNINGMSYRDLDSLFNLDPDKEIATLLERRDTWSGRTIHWPVEGTDLVVPVDLAALPTYSRNREFDGFRGFGIVRVADAERDPNAVGLTLATSKITDELTQAAADNGDVADRAQPAADIAPEAQDDVPLTVDSQFAGLHADKPVEPAPVVEFSEPETILPEGEPKEGTDEFQGEVPALKVVSNPLSVFSDKIIQLEERRGRGREGLTPTEQNAFREIARQLEPFGKRPNETLFDQQKQAPADEPEAEAERPEAEAAAAEPETPADAVPPQMTTEADSEERQDQTTADEPAGTSPPTEAEDQEGPTGDFGLSASGVDQIPLAILIHAGDRLIHANGEFKRFTGYDSLEALAAAGGLDALITRREGPDGGVYAIRADGSQHAVSARLQSVRYEGAKLLMLTLTPVAAPAAAESSLAEDQETARKLSALKVEADELRSILETATDGVVVLDMEGRIRSMNRSASALFNYEDSETRGKPFAMLFAHESQKAVQDYLNGLSGHGVASVLNDGREVIGREASGGFLPLFMTMGRMPGSNSYCAVMRDITQWKRSEEELRAAKRAAETANQHKSDFLARVSHEIRTPLNAIIGFSDMIASEHFGPAGHPRYVEYANDIGRSGRHVLDIVNDLLDISKIEAGEMDLEFAAVGINDCVSEAVSLVQPQANTQRVIIRTSLSQSVPHVVADLRSIKQIAINILANAIRFTPSGGQIVVSTAYEPNGSVTLRIRDTGVGMSKGELEQAMKPFGQVQPGARKRGDGTGLGLPLTKAMTEANRAIFSIQSAPNEGTLVEITFPSQRVLAD